MKTRKIVVLGVPDCDGVAIVTDPLTDAEVYLDDSGAKTVEVEVRGRTVKRKAFEARVTGQEGGYIVAVLPNGATVHVAPPEGAPAC